jgi:hypothetical protein
MDAGDRRERRQTREMDTIDAASDSGGERNGKLEEK